MDIFSIDLSAVFSFVLTFMRASLIIFMLPIFGVDSAPTQWKAYFVLIFTLAIWPHISLSSAEVTMHPLDLMVILLSELLLGIALGLSVQFFFSGLQAGGELIATQMGFTMISFADPMTGNQTTAIAHFLYMVAVLIFLSLDGHLYMLKAFTETYRYIPAGGLVVTDTLLNQVLTLSSTVFVFAIKIVAPVMVALFLMETTLALMNKVTPQLNVMEIGFPIKILVGFAFIQLLFNLIGIEVERYIRGIDDLFLNIIRASSPLFQN